MNSSNPATLGDCALLGLGMVADMKLMRGFGTRIGGQYAAASALCQLNAAKKALQMRRFDLNAIQHQ
ncbi:hypothetical protein [Paenibacillus radicis (ex Gao et al. 2016)]|uniref:Uncharacterized protein n=1 Tax=Paenibacillus radicis (ex Gao et al. 2016) TaxID=1737354 RepID=A0A917GY70_9BACL|nr:hypothetical protein [Paenibacillus radicis (ex Gao et al. 2016)]GGG61149.1 hypothetical protein GCM10010918_13190 [Paenibacillus radicis (ex Gao et al. 2016)]